MEPIIFAGTPENAAQTLKTLVNSGVQVALVITREDAPFGRKRELKASAVAEVADSLGLRVLKANRVTEEVLAEVRASRARLALVVAYGALLKKDAIDALELGWFNLHYSLLPRWRGASPVQSALLAGDTETGVTLFRIDEGVDTGLLVANVPTVIEPQETAGELLSRLTSLGASLALEQLPRLFSGFGELVVQTGAATHAPKYSRVDAQLFAADTGIEAENKVRAFNPEPIAWLSIGETQLRVLRARRMAVVSSAGSIRSIEGRVLAGFADGAIELLEVQPAGKTPMPAPDWWRGQKVEELHFP